MSLSQKLNRICFVGAGIALFFVSVFLIVQADEPDILANINVWKNNQFLSGGDALLPEVFRTETTEQVFLRASAPAFLVSGQVLGTLANSAWQEREVEEYIVETGETLSSIAAKFDISLETILWANNLSAKSVLKIGQKLAILPVSGAMHMVLQGDTLSQIAEDYKADTEDIINFNGLGNEGKIFAGDFLIVPNGRKPAISQNYSLVPLSGSYFICPIPSPCRITQGLHWFNAVDFSNGNCGEPVFAAAGGQVQRTGYTPIGGNYVRILHPNGVVTYYGHLSKISASPGQTVRQGQVIGSVGYTGRTIPAGPSGCHVHFDVRFASNPFARYSVGTQLGN